MKQVKSLETKYVNLLRGEDDSLTPQAFIDRLTDILKSLPEDAQDFEIMVSLDMGNCYYEGDSPTPSVDLVYKI